MFNDGWRHFKIIEFEKLFAEKSDWIYSEIVLFRWQLKHPPSAFLIFKMMLNPCGEELF